MPITRELETHDRLSRKRSSIDSSASGNSLDSSDLNFAASAAAVNVSNSKCSLRKCPFICNNVPDSLGLSVVMRNKNTLFYDMNEGNCTYILSKRD